MGEAHSPGGWNGYKVVQCKGQVLQSLQTRGLYSKTGACEEAVALFHPDAGFLQTAYDQVFLVDGVMHDQVSGADHADPGVIEDPVDRLVNDRGADGAFIQVQEPVPPEEKLTVDINEDALYPFGLEFKDGLVGSQVVLADRHEKGTYIEPLVLHFQKTGTGIDGQDILPVQFFFDHIRKSNTEVPVVAGKVQQVFPDLFPALRVEEVENDKDPAVPVLVDQGSVSGCRGPALCRAQSFMAVIGSENAHMDSSQKA